VDEEEAHGEEVEEIPSGGAEREEGQGLIDYGVVKATAAEQGKRERAGRRRVETCSRRWQGRPNSGGCRAESRAAPEEEEKGSFSRTYL
jgi:hypothetical protein